MNNHSIASVFWASKSATTTKMTGCRFLRWPTGMANSMRIPAERKLGRWVVFSVPSKSFTRSPKNRRDRPFFEAMIDWWLVCLFVGTIKQTEEYRIGLLGIRKWLSKESTNRKTASSVLVLASGNRQIPVQLIQLLLHHLDIRRRSQHKENVPLVRHFFAVLANKRQREELLLLELSTHGILTFPSHLEARLDRRVLQLEGLVEIHHAPLSRGKEINEWTCTGNPSKWDESHNEDWIDGNAGSADRSCFAPMAWLSRRKTSGGERKTGLRLFGPRE